MSESQTSREKDTQEIISRLPEVLRKQRWDSALNDSIKENPVTVEQFSSVLRDYIEGYLPYEEEGKTIKLRLAETLVRIALYSEDDRARVSALKMLGDRVDGKAVERKEIKSLKVQGIVMLPPVQDIAYDE